MGLLARLANQDSLQEMEGARTDRMWDGLACAMESRDFAACYLLGYAIEMALKTAYFRFIGVTLTEDLACHLKNMRALPSFGRGVNLHNLRAWAEALLETRRRSGRPVDPVLAGRLLYEVSRAATDWSEVMRYRRAVPAGRESSQLFDVLEWLQACHTQLWR